jgi:predicted NAD-dependent protein-ADP-ribosyltransferase YbiA (DUF1768 family)
MGALGLSHSTELFSASYKHATETGNTFVMGPALKTFSFLNRWFIFRRRSTGSTFAPLAMPTAMPLPLPLPLPPAAVPKPSAMPEEVEEVEELEKEVEELEKEVEELEKEVEEVPAEEAEVVGTLADGPVYQFYHKSGAKDELKTGDKHWRRYLSTFAPFKFRDTMNPDSTYSSLEAALGAAKYQVATSKPELGQQIFSDVGDIHQKIDAEKRALGAPLTADQEAEYIEKEGSAMRDAQKPAHMKKVRATWNDAAWIETRERILMTYLRQRYEGDAKFRDILAKIASQKARLVYYTAGGANELSGTIDGASIQGENLYGRALMRLANLRY